MGKKDGGEDGHDGEGLKVCLKQGQRYTIRDKTSDAGAHLPIIADNEDGITILAVDRGLIPDKFKQKKCDFLAISSGFCRKYFIELKGANLETAYEEILGTIHYLKSDKRYCNWLVCKSNSEAYGIITSPGRQKVPKVHKNKERKLAEALLKLNSKSIDNMFQLILYVKVEKNDCYSKNGNHIQCSGNNPLPL